METKPNPSQANEGFGSAPDSASLLTVATSDHDHNTSVLRCSDARVSTPSIRQSTIFFSVAFVTVTLNLALIVVVLRTKRLRRKTNFILVSMAAADLLVGLIGEPIWALALWVDDKDQKYLETAKFVVHFSLMSSVGHILVVSTERAIAVMKPLHYRAWVTCRRVQIVVLCVWIWSLFVAALHTTIWKSYSYYLFLVWTGFAVLAAMAVIHTLILRALKQATKALEEFSSNTVWYYRPEQQVTESEAVRNARLREKKKTKLVAIITLAFAICTLPSVVAETLCFTNVINQTVKNSISILFFVNSFINPIIFAFREPKFCTALKSMCGCSEKPKSGVSAAVSPRADHVQLQPSRSDTSDTAVSSQPGSVVNLRTEPNGST